MVKENCEMIYKIELPYVPISMNQTNTWHWAKRAKYKKQIEEDIYYLVKQLGVIKKFKYAKVRITYYFPDHRRRDIIDNYNPKFIMDGVVKAGILEDDRHEYVGVPELVAAYEKGRAHTIIEVWEDDSRCQEEPETTKNRTRNRRGRSMEES